MREGRGEGIGKRARARLKCDGKEPPFFPPRSPSLFAEFSFGENFRITPSTIEYFQTTP